MADAESKHQRPEWSLALTAAPASDIKRLGWRSVLERAKEHSGRLAVTSHNRLQAVILTPEAYETLIKKVEQQEQAADAELERLRAEFDERLAVLEGPEGAARLRAAGALPNELHGRVKAGESF